MIKTVREGFAPKGTFLRLEVFQRIVVSRAEAYEREEETFIFLIFKSLKDLFKISQNDVLMQGINEVLTFKKRCNHMVVMNKGNTTNEGI